MNTEQRTRWTIYRRLLLLGTLPALAMFLFMLLFFTQARLDDTREGLFQTSQVIADNLAPAVEFPVVTGDQRALEALLRETRQRSNVLRIAIRDRSGETVGLVGPSDEELAGDEGVHYFTSEIIQQPMEFAEEQAFLEFGSGSGAFGAVATRIGEVEVAVSEAVLAEEQRDILWTSAGIGVILFGGTLIFIGRLAYRLSVPIEHLVESIESLPDGDYRVDPSETRVARELQSLQRAISEMAIRLKASEQERQLTFQQLADARDKAESASNAKSEFLAMMSHEVRTPLNGVLGMLQLLEDEQNLTAGQTDYVVTARRSTEDLLVIINDILDFSRIERGRLELEHVSFELRGVIENCFATYRHQAEKKGLDYQLRFRGSWGEDLEVYGDPGRLRQIVAHLIGNAIKFTDEGRVVVTVHWAAHSENEGMLSCDFEDSGAGIPSDRISDMFSTFEQLDSSAARRFGGTGLGLPLVQRLVELMGGHIAVDTAPGCGSVFRFVVPLAVTSFGDDEHPTFGHALEGERPALPHGQSEYQALVVEDNAVNQRVAARLLENLGFHVQCANNGVAAVEAIESRHESYDVVLMDCQMPVMDGWEATRKIRAWERRTGSPELPIVAMTADVLDGTETSCREAGMNGYLPKPVRRESLRETLQRIIRL